MAKATYKDAGVDLELYADSMRRVAAQVGRTYGPRVLPLEGGFAGLFRLDFAGPLFARNYQDPVLVACTDGVGTKLKVAVAADRHDTVGIDLVAMCVNDAVCCGAEPLFFLDYVAMSHDDPPRLERIVAGIAAGCVEADCALLGGETAIMPDLYARGDYDLAGFCVGVAERRRVIDGRAIVEGDRVLGLAASGLHANGFSLVRKIVFEIAGLAVGDRVDPLGCTVGEELLRPTRIYVRPLKRVLAHYPVKGVIHGIAHITGGGLRENLERVLPEGHQAVIDRNGWPRPPVFDWLARLGDVAPEEMERVFNLGIGLALVVSPFYADSVRSQLADLGVPNWQIGHVRQGPRGVAWG
jgi:phosphoribosylformylglycinamidine cyclo-ligase